jgi:tRNA pseudouridine38-40 synthase
MRNIKLILQYDGTAYSGWQIQKKETTIQGLLENAVFAVTGERSRVTGAGRTDAGVHAFQQVDVFKTGSRLEPDALFRAMNANLPQDIRIIEVQEVGEDFHPRYRARSKTYSYLISGTGDSSVFLNRYSWQMHHHLDCISMREASDHLIGIHDFSSFRASGCSSKHPVSIGANAFLRHMVRNIVGTLVDVGRGRTTPDKVRDIMEAKDRRAAGQTAPACGLFLEKIVY